MVNAQKTIKECQLGYITFTMNKLSLNI